MCLGELQQNTGAIEFVHICGLKLHVQPDRFGACRTATTFVRLVQGQEEWQYHWKNQGYVK